MGAGKTARIVAALQTSKLRNDDAYKKWAQEKTEVNANRAFGKQNMLKLANTASYGEVHDDASKKETLKKLNAMIQQRDSYMQKNITESGGTAIPDSRATVKKWVIASGDPHMKKIADLL